MTRLPSGGVVLFALALAAASGCRRPPPGDGGGAATGDQVGEGRVGSAESHDSFEQARPVDTVPPLRGRRETGVDTSTR